MLARRMSEPKRIRCNECLRAIEESDPELAVEWILGHSCKRPPTVYAVLVDWGTVDGSPHQTKLDSVYSKKADAVERVREAMRHTPFPAVHADVVEELVR